MILIPKYSDCALKRINTQELLYLNMLTICTEKHSTTRISIRFIRNVISGTKNKITVLPRTRPENF